MAAKRKPKAKRKAKRRGRRGRSAPWWGAWSLRACPVEAPPSDTWRLEWRDHALTLLRAYSDGLLANPARLAASRAGRARLVPGGQGVLEVCYAVHVWAKRHKINPVGWARWTGRRVRSDEDGLARLACLFDAARIPTYLDTEMVSVNEAAAADAELHTRLGAAGFVAGRDMHAGAELAKQHFRERGREILCIDAHDLTFGYHADSTWCASCPLRDDCKAKTFDRLQKRDQ